MKFYCSRILHVVCCPHSSLEAVRDLDLLEDVINVGLYRVGTQAVGIRNNRIGESHAKTVEDVDFLGCQ